METKIIRVLVIDDSALVRKTISDTLELDPEIEVVGVANERLQRERGPIFRLFDHIDIGVAPGGGLHARGARAAGNQPRLGRTADQRLG